MSASPSRLPAAIPDRPIRRRLSSEDRRTQLIAQAIEMFSRHGFSGTRTRDIAAACGVSEGVLFHHFATKDDLYQAILQSHAEEAGSREWMESMKKLAAKRKDREVMHLLTAHILRSFQENASFHRLLMFAWLEGHALADLAHQQFGMPSFDFLRKYVAQRQKEGAFRAGDPATLVVAIYAPALQHAMNKNLFHMDLCGGNDVVVADELADAALAAVSAEPAHKKNTSAKKKKS